VLPLVVYNGKRRWQAPLSLEALFTPLPPGLQRFLPKLTYLLLDENRLDLDRPELQRNRVAALFRIETCGDARDLPRLTKELGSLLPRGRDPELRRRFALWLRSVLQRTFPGATIPETIELEDAPMLEETLIEWRDKAWKEGLREGRKEGRKEGRVEGKREGEIRATRRVLLDLMTQRFGPLPEPVRMRVGEISSAAELRKLAKRVLRVSSLHEMGIGT
jgi:hypothetical protein